MKRKCAINICFAERKAEVWGKSPRKKTRGIRPRRCSPSLQDAKYITVTQDSSPSLCSERPDEISVWQSETGGLGQVTMKKKGIFRPRENKRNPRGIRARCCSPSPRVQNIFRSLKARSQVVQQTFPTNICLAKRKPGVWG